MSSAGSPTRAAPALPRTKHPEFAETLYRFSAACQEFPATWGGFGGGEKPPRGLASRRSGASLPAPDRPSDQAGPASIVRSASRDDRWADPPGGDPPRSPGASKNPRPDCSGRGPGRGTGEGGESVPRLQREICARYFGQAPEITPRRLSSRTHRKRSEASGMPRPHAAAHRIRRSWMACNSSPNMVFYRTWADRSRNSALPVWFKMGHCVTLRDLRMGRLAHARRPQGQGLAAPHPAPRRASRRARPRGTVPTCPGRSSAPASRTGRCGTP